MTEIQRAGSSVRGHLIRVGLLVVGIPTAVTGGWALFAPRSFYGSFPRGAAHAWVSPLGPYEEHLVTDVGALLLALSVLLVIAAAVLERRLVMVAAVTSLVFNVPHLVFHVSHREGLSGIDNTLNLGLLGGTVLIMVAVLVGASRRAVEAER